MARSLVITLAATLSTAGCCLCGSKDDSRAVQLFNGENLDGWVIESGGDFSVRDGVLVVNKGTGWLRSEEEFGDFTLVMEFRFLENEANSGIFVRTAATSAGDENGWPDNGYQVQCMDIITGERPLATMIPYGGPGLEEGDAQSDLEALARAYRPTGEWNEYEITCRGTDITVKLNGEVITTSSRIEQLRGHIGIQAEHGLLEFRRIEVMVLE